MTNVLANDAIQCCLDPQSGLLEMRNLMTASGTIETLACGKDKKNISKLLQEIASAAVFNCQPHVLRRVGTGTEMHRSKSTAEDGELWNVWLCDLATLLRLPYYLCGTEHDRMPMLHPTAPQPQQSGLTLWWRCPPAHDCGH